MNSTRSVKILIFLFWSFVIGFFLYSPKLIDKIFFSEKELVLFTFSGIIPPEVIDDFRKKTGINIHVKHFETNEELVAKLKISGSGGYDILVASDYTVDILAKKGFIKKVNKDKLTNFGNIDKRVLNKYYDPNSEYSIPLSWDIYGIGYNKNLGDLKDRGWELIFDTPSFNKDLKICMLNDPRDAIYISAMHLFGSMQNLIDEKLEKIRSLLLKQRSWVELYAIDRLDDFLLSGLVDIALVPGEFIRKVFFESDDFGFVIPKNGSLMTIEHMVISSSSDKLDAAHRFMDYVLDAKVSAYGSNKYGFYPVNIKSYPLLNKKHFESFFSLTDKDFEKINIVKSGIPRRKLEDLWLSVKAS